MRASVAFSLALILSQSCLHAADRVKAGDFDKTFGTANGVCRFEFGFPATAGAIAIRNLGTSGAAVRLIAAGASNGNKEPLDRIVVAACDQDGKHAETHAIPLPKGHEFIHTPEALAVDSKGRIIVAGNASDANGDGRTLVARLTADYQPDKSFHGTGFHVLKLPDGGRVHCAGWQRANVDGNDREMAVVAGCKYDKDGELEIFAVRFEENGDLDPSFGAKGWATAPDGEARALCFEPHPDGTGDCLILAGSGDIDKEFVIVRFDSHGKLDADFAEKGVSRVKMTGVDKCVAEAVAVNRDVIVAGGYVKAYAAVGPESITRGAILKYKNGRLDANFNQDKAGGTPTGIRLIESDALNFEVRAVVLDGKGAIVVGGQAMPRGSERESEGQYLLARILPDGNLDAQFGNEGVVTGLIPDTDGNACESMILEDQNRVAGVIFAKQPGTYNGVFVAAAFHAPPPDIATLDPATVSVPPAPTQKPAAVGKKTPRKTTPTSAGKKGLSRGKVVIGAVAGKGKSSSLSLAAAKRGAAYLTDRDYTIRKLPKEAEGGTLIVRDTSEIESWLRPNSLALTKDCVVYVAVLTNWNGQAKVNGAILAEIENAGWTPLETLFETVAPGNEHWEWKMFGKPHEAGELDLEMSIGLHTQLIFIVK